MSQVRAIQLRRGTRAELDSYGPLLIGELGFCTDTKELFIGTPSGNILVNPETIDWSKVTGKPGTFTPSSHSHAWGDITGKPSTFTPSSHSHAWGDITGKPSTFTPSEHTHEEYSTVQALDAHTATRAALDKLGHVNHVVLTTTLNTTWQGSTAPYTKTQTVNGLLATDTPIVDVVMSGNFATDEARIEAWGYVYRITTANNSITLYATEKPTVSLPIQIKVVR